MDQPSRNAAPSGEHMIMDDGEEDDNWVAVNDRWDLVRECRESRHCMNMKNSADKVTQENLTELEPS